MEGSGSLEPGPLYKIQAEQLPKFPSDRRLHRNRRTEPTLRRGLRGINRIGLGKYPLSWVMRAGIEVMKSIPGLHTGGQSL
jgi:hypothetical protein